MSASRFERNDSEIDSAPVAENIAIALNNAILSGKISAFDDVLSHMDDSESSLHSAVLSICSNVRAAALHIVTDEPFFQCDSTNYRTYLNNLMHPTVDALEYAFALKMIGARFGTSLLDASLESQPIVHWRYPDLNDFINLLSEVTWYLASRKDLHTQQADVRTILNIFSDTAEHTRIALTSAPSSWAQTVRCINDVSRN